MRRSVNILNCRSLTAYGTESAALLAGVAAVHRTDARRRHGLIEPPLQGTAPAVRRPVGEMKLRDEHGPAAQPPVPVLYPPRRVKAPARDGMVGLRGRAGEVRYVGD